MTEIDDRLAIAPLLDGAAQARGPLRPEQLVNVRRRRDRQLAAHRFRALDTIVLIAVALLLLRRALGGPLLDAALADVLPAAVGVWAAWWALPALQLYRFGRNEHLAGHLARLVAVTAATAATAGLLQGLLSSRVTTATEAMIVVSVSGAALGATHTAWWGVVARWRRRGWLTPNIVLVGATKDAEDLVETTLARRDVHILGVFDDRAERSPQSIHGVPVLGTTDALLRHRIVPFIDLIVVAIDPTATTRVREVMTRLAVLPNSVTVLVDGSGTGHRADAIGLLGDAPLAPLRAAVDPARRAYAKRVQDLTLAVPAVVLLSPVIALIALAIRLDTRGPVFFRQRRHGFNNEEIVVWKFRTMRHDAADLTAARQVVTGDERVTRVGRVLRKTGLDEMPQLFNVVSGEMSLVGPRPHAIGMRTGEQEAALLVADYAHRHRIRPGITGWAAINGSRGPVHTADEIAERVALDVAYIERQSLWLDLLIMAKTLPTLLGDRAAVR